MKKYLVLIIIFALALTLRFYKLSSFRCLNWDEAAFGYNAYSILLTGKDEYGAKLPLQFKSVGDYKAPLYIYLMVPVIKVLGLNSFSVRFLPAFLGSLTVIVFYFLVQELFKNINLALVSSLFLAISPWHIQFTKAGADVGIATFFTLLGIYGFIKGTKGAKLGYVLAAISFSASIYSYFAERLFVPLISFFLLFFYRKEVSKTRKNFLWGLIVGLILLLPIVSSLFSGGHREKILKTTVFGYQRSSEYLNLINREDHYSKFLFNFFHAGFLESGLGIVNHYLNHFSPSFLFFQGVAGDLRQFIYRMGVMYFYDLPLILLGIYFLLKSKEKQKYFIIGWILLAPIPAAITRDQFSARRSFNLVYPLLILSAYGLLVIVERIKRFSKKIRTIISSVGIGFMFCCFVFYLISYYVFTAKLIYPGPAGWHCGYKELVSYVQQFKSQAREIVVDTSYQGPYIFFLFYEKYDPASYQKQAKLVQDSPDSLGEGAGYDKYVFRPIYWPDDRGLKNTVFAGPPERLPEKDLDSRQVTILNTIYFPDNTEAFRVVKTNK